MSEFPWSPGTFVLCRHRDDDLPIRRSCRDHIWEIATEAKCLSDDRIGPTILQAARCLVCGGPPTPLVSAEFFYHKATPMDVAGVFGEIAEAQEWLAEVKAKLEAWWLNGGETPQSILRNYD